MSCIICGEASAHFLGTINDITVAYCIAHADECITSGAICRCEVRL